MFWCLDRSSSLNSETMSSICLISFFFSLLQVYDCRWGKSDLLFSDQIRFYQRLLRPLTIFAIRWVWERRSRPFLWRISSNRNGLCWLWYLHLWNTLGLKSWRSGFLNSTPETSTWWKARPIQCTTTLFNRVHHLGSEVTISFIFSIEKFVLSINILNGLYLYLNTSFKINK